MTDQEITERAAGTARSFTVLGIEGIIRHNRKVLREIAEMDETLGERGREARAFGRGVATERLRCAEEALRIRKEMEDAS